MSFKIHFLENYTKIFWSETCLIRNQICNLLFRKYNLSYFLFGIFISFWLFIFKFSLVRVIFQSVVCLFVCFCFNLVFNCLKMFCFSLSNYDCMKQWLLFSTVIGMKGIEGHADWHSQKTLSSIPSVIYTHTHTFSLAVVLVNYNNLSNHWFSF